MSSDRDPLWITRENLRKRRHRLLDPEWIDALLARLGWGDCGRSARSEASAPVTWVARELLGSPFDFIFVPAVYELLKRQVRNSEMREGGHTVYGLFGYAFLALSFLTLFAKSPGMAEAHIDDDQATKNALEAVSLPQVDPNGWIVYGGIVTWVVVATKAAPTTPADTGDTPAHQRAGGSAHSAVAPGRRS